MCPFCGREGIPNWNNTLAGITRFTKEERPINDGHYVVFPRRHVKVFSSLLEPELHAMLASVLHTQRMLRRAEPLIKGFNVGWDDGYAAGQVSDHVCVHVIPRYQSDVPDPSKSGLRYVIPEVK